MRSTILFLKILLKFLAYSDLKMKYICLRSATRLNFLCELLLHVSSGGNDKNIDNPQPVSILNYERSKDEKKIVSYIIV